MAKFIKIDGVFHEAPGHAALWRHFGLSYASWLVLPRVLMHEMPDDWQARMAQLLAEVEREFPNQPDIDYSVSCSVGGKFVKIPDWVAYRYPDTDTINSWRAA